MRRLRSKIEVVSEPMLATMVVGSYNQQKFIREAVEGAFSQTYSPLEIFLTDDCSTDATFEIMESMAREYHGPHVVRLNRNEQNLGIVAHVNKTFQIAKGEIRVGAAGDDISLPQRVERLVTEFDRSPDVMCVTSGAEVFGNKRGLVIPWAHNRKLHLLELCALNLGQQGSSSAYRRAVFDEFPRMTPETKAEDYALTFRACLLGKRIAIPDVLVKYRSHGGNAANTRPDQAAEVASRNLSTSSMRQAQRDLEYYCARQKINPRLARSALQLQIEFKENRALAADPNGVQGDVSRAYFRMVFLAKCLKFLHPVSWLQARRLAKKVHQMQSQFAALAVNS